MAVALVLYQLIGCLAAVIGIPYLVLLRPREARERLGFQIHAAQPGCVWVHAASLGEFEAAWPLLRTWGEEGRASRLLVSCTNAVARSRIAQRLPEGARVCLAPLDLWPCVRRALRQQSPSCLVFVETELWPAWILAAARCGIPMAVVSARLSDRTFPRYRRLRPLLRPLLRRLQVIGCRTERDRAHWIAIGAPEDRCVVWGNTKYEVAEPARRLPPRRTHERFVLVAGSVRRGEEKILDLLQSIPMDEIRLLVVPRHLRDVPFWENTCLRQQIACRRLSLAGLDPTGSAVPLLQVLRQRNAALPAVILVDRVGVLRDCYRLADAAFVGGTWVPIGGHNLFEPAREGVPVLFGPSIGGVRDAAEALKASGGGVEVRDSRELVAVVTRLREAADRQAEMGAAARRAAEALAGGVARTVSGLRALGIPPGDAA